MLPHELHEPFSGGEDRANAVELLLDLWDRLEELERLADLPMNQWSPEQLGWLPVHLRHDLAGAAARLARWRSLFADELSRVRSARDGAARLRVSDVELRTAIYLAERLLASAHGREHGAEDAV